MNQSQHARPHVGDSQHAKAEIYCEAIVLGFSDSGLCKQHQKPSNGNPIRGKKVKVKVNLTPVR
jgi:hypothetical protein